MKKILQRFRRNVLVKLAMALCVIGALGSVITAILFLIGLAAYGTGAPFYADYIWCKMVAVLIGLVMAGYSGLKLGLWASQ